MKIGLNGIFGRMGQELAKIIEQDPSLTLTAEIDRNHKVIKEMPDVWVDFSAQPALISLLEMVNGNFGNLQKKKAAGPPLPPPPKNFFYCISRRIRQFGII